MYRPIAGRGSICIFVSRASVGFFSSSSGRSSPRVELSKFISGRERK